MACSFWTDCQTTDPTEQCRPRVFGLVLSQLQLLLLCQKRPSGSLACQCLHGTSVSNVKTTFHIVSLCCKNKVLSSVGCFGGWSGQAQRTTLWSENCWCVAKLCSVCEQCLQGPQCTMSNCLFQMLSEWIAIVWCQNQLRGRGWEVQFLSVKCRNK